MSVIETHDLTKFYGKSRGILQVNLTVEEGDIFGFIGPNGAGKSTTIRTLLGLLSPTSGKATVFGKDCTGNITDILADVGYVPSEAMFYPSMRVQELIALSARLHKRDCSSEARRLCERFQLDGHKRIDELSLGNRKKVGIVCALQHKPSLYILDEATSGLDPLMQKEFFAVLEERHREGCTIFLSSHVLSEIQRHCHHAAIIRDGRLLVSDTVEALTRTAARRIALHGITEPPAISGVRDAAVTDNTVTFLYQGDIPPLIAALQGLPLTDMTIAESDLEDIFLHYYTDGGEQA